MRKFSGNLDEAHRTALRVAAKHGLKLPDLDESRGVGDMSWKDLHAERIKFRHLLSDIDAKIRAENREANKDEALALDYVLHLAQRCSDEIDARSAYNYKEPGEPMGGPPSGRADAPGDWRTAEGKRVHVLRPDQRVASVVRDGEAADDGLGFGQLVRAMLVGGKTDAERRALSEGTNADGGFTVNAILSAQVIDRMRAKSRVIQAGALTVPLDTLETKIARVSADPVVSWKAENAAASDVQPTLEQITFTARTLICLVRASRELIEDSVNANEMLAMVFAAAMAGELDRAAIYGSGVSPEPRGLDLTSGIGEVQVLTSLSSWDPLVDGVEKMLTANAQFPTAGILHPKTLAALAKLKDTTNQPLQKPDMLKNLPLLESTQCKLDEGGSPAGTSIWLGNWPELIIGVRAALRVEVLRERYADSYQLGFLAHLRADVQLLHAASFCRVRDISV